MAYNWKRSSRMAGRPDASFVAPIPAQAPKPLTDRQKDRLLKSLALRALELYGPDNAAERLKECFHAMPLETYRAFCGAWKSDPDSSDDREQTEQALLAEIDRLRAELGEQAPVIDVAPAKDG